MKGKITKTPTTGELLRALTVLKLYSQRTGLEQRLMHSLDRSWFSGFFNETQIRCNTTGTFKPGLVYFLTEGDYLRLLGRKEKGVLFDRKPDQDVLRPSPPRNKLRGYAYQTSKPSVKEKKPQIIFSGPATVVIWPDKTKTFVKCTKADWAEGKCDRKLGYLMCAAMYKQKWTKTQLHKRLAWIKPERVYEWLFKRYMKDTGFSTKQAQQALLKIEKDTPVT